MFTNDGDNEEQSADDVQVASPVITDGKIPVGHQPPTYLPTNQPQRFAATTPGHVEDFSQSGVPPFIAGPLIDAGLAAKESEMHILGILPIRMGDMSAFADGKVVMAGDVAAAMKETVRKKKKPNPFAFRRYRDGH